MSFNFDLSKVVKKVFSLFVLAFLVVLVCVAVLAVFSSSMAPSRPYYYATEDMQEAYCECAAKCPPFKPWECSTYEQLIMRKPELVRLTARNWFVPWLWYSYLTHPRWQLPYRVTQEGFFEQHFRYLGNVPD